MHLNAARFRFSKIHFSIVLMLHLMALFCVLFSAVSVSIKLIIVLLLIGYAPRSFAQPKNNFKLIGKNQDDYWYWVLATHSDNEIVQLLPGTIRTRWFVLLVFKTVAGKKHFIPVFPGALHSDDFRRLKAVLFCQKVPSPTIADRLKKTAPS